MAIVRAGGRRSRRTLPKRVNKASNVELDVLKGIFLTSSVDGDRGPRAESDSRLTPSWDSQAIQLLRGITSLKDTHILKVLLGLVDDMSLGKS